MRFLGIAVVAGAAMVLGACGGGDTTPAATDTPVVEAPVDQAPVADAGVAMPITGTIHVVNMVGDDKGYKYEPAEITIKAGDGIKFMMVSGGPHNVAFDATLLPADVNNQLVANMPTQAAPLMGPMMLNPGEEYTMSFAGVTPGTYEFFCTPHLAMGMTGKVTITP